MSDNGKIISSKITSVSYNKQKTNSRNKKSEDFKFDLNGNYTFRKYH